VLAARPGTRRLVGVTQAQPTGVRRDADQGPDHPRAGAASHRRARDRVILTQPPPPPPTPRRPARDDEEPPPPQTTSAATGDERREELLAEIDELVDGR
jgi:hypothetical protein